jgi:hypothetical protein
LVKTTVNKNDKKIKMTKILLTSIVLCTLPSFVAASGTDFGVMLDVAMYLFLLYFLGKVFKYCSIPVILAEIGVGILVGPKLLDNVPYASDGTCQKFPDTCDDVMWYGTHQVSIWQFIGNVGVTLMIMESGMHINFKEVRAVGLQALGIATVGTLLPVGIGILFVGALCDGAYYPDGFAAGIALAPTSVGIAIKMLEESKMLSSKPGECFFSFLLYTGIQYIFKNTHFLYKLWYLRSTILFFMLYFPPLFVNRTNNINSSICGRYIFSCSSCHYAISSSRRTTSAHNDTTII